MYVTDAHVKIWHAVKLPYTCYSHVEFCLEDLNYLYYEYYEASSNQITC